MSRMRAGLLVVCATLLVALGLAGTAQAATQVIDVAPDQLNWAPENVTIDAGDTVEWQFDAATIGHDVTSDSENWEFSTGPKAPNSAPASYTFDEPGVYEYVCSIHAETMTGTITVEDADPATLSKVLVFSKTGGFRHDSIPAGITAIQALGQANNFTVDATENANVFTAANLSQYDVVVFLSTTGEILTTEQQAAFEGYIQSGGGFAGIHAASDTEYEWPWYGELVGGYFRSHPPGTPTATVDIEDADEPSTTGLPAEWTRTDEWYNFQHPTTPAINGNGTVADFSPRARHVKVLATVDESTYDEQDGNAANDDHPVAWCSDFDGGRSWYTAMGHTQASFTDTQFRQHLLGGLRTAAGDGECGEARTMPPVAADFEKVTLNNDTNAPMEIDIAPDGRAFYVELDGRVQMYSPGSGQTTTIGTVPVSLVHENGLMGIQLAPDFTISGHIYLVYAALPDIDANGLGRNRISRFTLTGNTLSQEQVIYEWSHQRRLCCHTGGSLEFGANGDLYLSTGDNTNPFAHGYNPTDERPGRGDFDAQRTSANTNDPNGKVLRIRPIPNVSGVPAAQAGVGTTYTIPPGNMFDEAQDAQNKTLPEIYAMGFRNPFRIHYDPETGNVLLGDYGPDAGTTNANRGPQGSVEYNIITQPGFYGWPYCIRENVPYNDITYTADNGAGTNNGKYNCAAPVNNSPNNTGLTNLPPAQPAAMWMAYSETDARFPDLGTGGAPTGGPVYHYDEDLQSDSKFPKFYDDQWFIGEWNNDWVKTVTLNNGDIPSGVACFAICTGYISPMDLEFGPNGSLYVVEWGQGFAENNADSGVYRIDYIQGERLPIAVAAADNDAVPVGTTVNFTSTGSRDPDGTDITFSWDFDDGGPVSTEPNPTRTFDEAGTYDVTLTVTDESGATATDVVRVIVGNQRPVVTITTPENGQVADFGDKVNYNITVTDPDGGPGGTPLVIDQGDPQCAQIRVEIKLGHDTHAHELQSTTGCAGQAQITGVEGHDANTNVFTVITASYTDAGNGPAQGVTGVGEVILQPKQKQAEFFQTTGRQPDSIATEGTPGITNEATTDVGGGQAAAFVEDGDWISFNPYNLEELDTVTFRVASAGAGGTISLHYDDPTSPAVLTTPLITPTGGWQTWKDVTVELPDTLPGGTHRLFIVFNHPTATGSLMNLNWFKFAGKGAAITAPPTVTAEAEPTTGEAPLPVSFDATASDPEGEALTYAWDFGVPGTTNDTSTQEDPDYTYASPGNYTATVTVTDAQGAKATAQVEVRVTRKLDECPTGPVRSDEFEGNALDLDRWEYLRPDAQNPATVSNGVLNLPINNGSMYGPGTSATNVIVQEAPEGEWMVTAKIATDPLTENYHQAGLRLWSDDNNWASVHMIHAGGNRTFEFIFEDDGNPRNEGADNAGPLPADAPHEYYVRIMSDGEEFTAAYSFDGVTFTPVGRPAPVSAFPDPLKVGPTALSDAAPSVPVSRFDWIRFDPDGSTGGPVGIEDEFDGTTLDGAWERIRGDQAAVVTGGTLQIPAQAGDLYQDRNDAKNLIVRPAPAGPWEAITKLNFKGSEQYHQAGMLVYGDDQNFTKFGRIATNAPGSALAEKFEFIYENNGTARNAQQDSTANLPANFPNDFWLKMSSDGTNVTGEYTTDGVTWVPVGREAPLPANAKIGLFAFSNNGANNPVAAFDSFSLESGSTSGGGGGGPAGPSRDDQFDGSSLDKSRWNAIVRDTPAEYSVDGGELTITTSPGDIYQGDTNPPPNNFILQSADHAGEDWVIETKVSGTINGGYAQGGLLAYQDGDNYVKLDAISDTGNTRINRIELRSEVAGAIQEPQPQITTIPVGTTDIWLRLTKTGASYTGEYSLDGTAWLPVTAAAGNAVTNPMVAPEFGLFAFGPQAEGQGDTVSFDYFLLDGEDTGECGCVAYGDEYEGDSLDATRWNAIAHDDPTKYDVADGALTVTTTAGEIYQGSSGGGPLLLQSADHADEDWVIETTMSAWTIDTGYSQGGLMAYGSDNDYVKLNAISDDNQPNVGINRLELRSESGGTIGTSGTDPQVPAGTETIGLRLTKTGNTYSAEYKFDDGAWTAFGYTVTNAMTAPRFGVYTQGVLDSGDTITFDYFALNGETGCEPGGEDNTPPSVGDVTASPTVGVGPLEVDFTAAATDADGDDLTYSWDFDGDGTEDSDEQNPTYTYEDAGTYEAEVTVSDGEDERSKTVTVTVLAEDDPEADFRVLVFSKTAGFRHDSIGPGIAAIRELGEANDFQVDATEDATAFRADVLSHYDAVVWLSTTGDVLNDAQQAAFEDFIQDNGGYAGIHAAADTEYGWAWYGDLVGGYFKNHPPGTPTATVNIEDTDHPSTTGIPTPWQRTDEWYNYQSPDNPNPGGGGADYSPRTNPNIHVLATVDEATYVEQDDSDGVNDDHPIAWCQRYDGGRSWYTGMGHTAGSFAEPDFREHLLGGIQVAAGAVADPDCGVEEPGDDLDVTAYADPSSGTAPLKVNFTATVGFPNAGGLKYRWEVPGAGEYLGESFSYTFTTPGTKTVTLTVEDAEGNTGTDTVTVTVAGTADQAPVILDADADVKSGPAPLEVWFHAAARDPEGGALTYRWEFGDGGTAFGAEVEHTYMTKGTYTATLTVTDVAGKTATRTFAITVSDPPANRAPSVEAVLLSTPGNAPVQVQLSAQGTDPDGDVLTYAWDFGDGTTGTGRRARHTYTANGTFTATVTASDGKGGTDTDTVQVVVGNPAGNQAPTVQAAADPVGGTAPLTVNFTSAAVDPDGDALVYEWDFGDTMKAGGPKATHTFATAGTYTVKVTATDARGAKGTATLTVTVTATAGGSGQPAAPPAPGAAAPALADLVRRAGAPVTVSCGDTGKAKVKLRISRKLAQKLGLKSRVIGVKTVQCTAGQKVTVQIRATKKARRALKRKAPQSLKTAVTVALDGVQYRDATVTFK